MNEMFGNFQQVHFRFMRIAKIDSKIVRSVVQYIPREIFYFCRRKLNFSKQNLNMSTMNRY